MIYFDNAATTLLCEDSKKILMGNYGNPSSPHTFGLKSERLIKIAAKDIASILHCKNNEIIFTSGGTESNNLGILGIAIWLKSKKGKDKPLYIMTNKYEHPSVTEPLKYLASLPEFIIENNISEYTDLICISQVNSETGDITEIKKPRNSILFVDGAQAFCKVVPPVEADLYSFSSHKIHGPTGVGGLKVKTGLHLQALMYGGGQQNNIRPGTENVSGILAMVAAAKNFCDTKCNSKIKNIKQIMMQLVNEVPNVQINQTKNVCSEYILNISFGDVKGETLTNMLSSKGLYVSMGTACRTKKGKLSALEEMGINRQMAESAIRLSFSLANTEEEAHRAKVIIKECVEELRASF